MQTKDQKNKQRQKRKFDSHHGARELSQSGDRGWVPERKSEAEVQEEVAHSLSQSTLKTEHLEGTGSTSFICQVQRRPAQLKRVNQEKQTKRVIRTNQVHHPGCKEATVLRDRPSDLTRVGQTEQGTVCVTYCVYACLGVCVCLKRGDVVLCIRYACH